MDIKEKITEILLQEIAVDSIVEYLLGDISKKRFDSKETSLGYSMAVNQLKSKLNQIIFKK